ncbi:MAG: beta-propeller fold lactonase family protein, partial [Gemmatimonadetes bacterium]|nr:beta-propeller fold lactonase family protein [Gemmatimonadota bacterium]
IDEAGQLTAKGHQDVPATPRNLVLDPTGTWLYSGGQNTNTVPVFRIQGDGGLTATGDVLQTPSPVCLKILSCS